MNDSPIRAYFDTQLSTILASQGVDTSTQVAWPAIVFNAETFDADKDWYQPLLMLGEPNPAALGVAAQNHHYGTYQVILYGRTTGDNTEQDFLDLMDPLREAFKRGVSYSGIDAFGNRYCITFNKSWIFSSERDMLTARWMVNLRARFNIYMDN